MEQRVKHKLLVQTRNNFQSSPRGCLRVGANDRRISLSAVSHLEERQFLRATENRDGTELYQLTKYKIMILRKRE
jgi:hypothetical protein